MNKFPVFLLVTAALLLATDRMTSFILDSLYVRTKTGQSGGTINHYLSMKPTPELLVMGNSRALYQVIPDSFSLPAFNLSHAGMGPAFQTGLLSVLENAGKLPNVVLLHIEPYEFTTDYKATDVLNLKFFYGKNEVVTRYIRETSSYAPVKFVFELYRHNGRIVSLLKNFFQTRQQAIRGNGYEMLMPSRTDSATTISSFQKLQWQKESPINITQLEKLQEFIDLCKQENVRLICFTSPIFRSKNLYPKTTSLIDSLLISNHIPYVNQVANPIDTLNSHPEWWHDAYHLNNNGAQIQSSVLSTELKKIFLRTSG